VTAYLVGIDNPHSSDPDHALDPRAPGSAGERLFQLSGMSLEEYERAFRRVNAVDDPRFPAGAHLIFLGRRAWDFVGFPGRPAFFSTVKMPLGFRLTLIPHPSGKNLMYNDETNRQRAGEILREAARA
jgi:hypothetical protein